MSDAAEPVGLTSADLGAVDLGVVDLASQLRRALLRSSRRIRSEKSDSDLSDSQYFVLAVLEVEGPRTPGELATIEDVRPPSMTRTLGALAERGLVERHEDPHDRRSTIVRITPAGTLEILETRRRRNAWLAGRLADLTGPERDVLSSAAEILRRISTQ